MCFLLSPSYHFTLFSLLFKIILTSLRQISIVIHHCRSHNDGNHCGLRWISIIYDCSWSNTNSSGTSSIWNAWRRAGNGLGWFLIDHYSKSIRSKFTLFFTSTFVIYLCLCLSTANFLFLPHFIHLFIYHTCYNSCLNLYNHLVYPYSHLFFFPSSNNISTIIILCTLKLLSFLFSWTLLLLFNMSTNLMNYHTEKQVIDTYYRFIVACWVAVVVII